ncbi:hypothetical protein ABPG74_001220 [Tetrahymena malaccensis]
MRRHPFFERQDFSSSLITWRKQQQNLVLFKPEEESYIQNSPISHKYTSKNEGYIYNNNKTISVRFILPIDLQINKKEKKNSHTHRDREKKLKIFIFFNFFHLISFRLIGSVTQFSIHNSHTHTFTQPSPTAFRGKCAFVAPKYCKFLSLLHICCVKEIEEEE